MFDVRSDRYLMYVLARMYVAHGQPDDMGKSTCVVSSQGASIDGTHFFSFSLCGGPSRRDMKKKYPIPMCMCTRHLYPSGLLLAKGSRPNVEVTQKSHGMAVLILCAD